MGAIPQVLAAVSCPEGAIDLLDLVEHQAPTVVAFSVLRHRCPLFHFSSVHAFAMDQNSGDSDTESESVCSLTEDAPALFQPPPPRPQLDVPTHLSGLAEEMEDAVDFINELDCDHIEDVCGPFRTNIYSLTNTRRISRAYIEPQHIYSKVWK